MNIDHPTRLIFKKLYINVKYSDLGDLSLVGKISKISTRLMLNIEADFAVFKVEFKIERKLGVFTKMT